MEEIDKIFDAAGKVLEAAMRDQELAGESIKNLNDVVKNLERRNQELRKQIQQEVKDSLESSLDSIVNIVAKKFQNADKAVSDANWKSRLVILGFVLFSISFIAGSLCSKFILR